MAKLVFMLLDLNLLEIFAQVFLSGLNKNNKNLIIFQCKALATFQPKLWQDQVYECFTHILDGYLSIFH
jgi:hypothetical protein